MSANMALHNPHFLIYSHYPFDVMIEWPFPFVDFFTPFIVSFLVSMSFKRLVVHLRSACVCSDVKICTLYFANTSIISDIFLFLNLERFISNEHAGNYEFFFEMIRSKYHRDQYNCIIFPVSFSHSNSWNILFETDQKFRKKIAWIYCYFVNYRGFKYSKFKYMNCFVN